MPRISAVTPGSPLKETDFHGVFQSRAKGELEANDTAGVQPIGKTVKVPIDVVRLAREASLA